MPIKLRETYFKSFRTRFQYEPRIQYEQKYLEAIQSFNIDPDYLKHFGAYPFGGFIRDIYHNQSPRDLDLLFFDIYSYQDFCTLLKSDPFWDVTPKISSQYEEGYFKVLAEEVTSCINSENKKVDLIYLRHFPTLYQIDFFANLFALDLETNSFFYWAENPEPAYLPLFNKSFQFLETKEAILNPLYHTKDPELVHRLIQKIDNFKLNNWNLNFSTFFYVLPKRDLYLNLDRWMNLETSRYFLVKCLTSEKVEVRALANSYLQKLEKNKSFNLMELIELFQRHYTKEVLLKELQSK